MYALLRNYKLSHMTDGIVYAQC